VTNCDENTLLYWLEISPSIKDHYWVNILGKNVLLFSVFTLPRTKFSEKSFYFLRIFFSHLLTFFDFFPTISDFHSNLNFLNKPQIDYFMFVENILTLFELSSGQ